MERPRYSHYEDANQYEVDLESYAEYADHKIVELKSEINRLKEDVLKELNMAMDHYNNDQFAHRAKAMASYISEAIDILSQNKH